MIISMCRNLSGPLRLAPCWENISLPILFEPPVPDAMRLIFWLPLLVELPFPDMGDSMSDAETLLPDFTESRSLEAMVR